MITEISFLKPGKIYPGFMDDEKQLSESIKLEKIALRVDLDKSGVLINNILKQIEKIEGNNFKPDKIVLSLDNYDILTAGVCSRLYTNVKPKKLKGIELVVIPEPDNYCKVIGSVEDEFLFRGDIRS